MSERTYPFATSAQQATAQLDHLSISLPLEYWRVINQLLEAAPHRVAKPILERMHLQAKDADARLYLTLQKEQKRLEELQVSIERQQAAVLEKLAAADAVHEREMVAAKAVADRWAKENDRLREELVQARKARRPHRKKAAQPYTQTDLSESYQASP